MTMAQWATKPPGAPADIGAAPSAPTTGTPPREMAARVVVVQTAEAALDNAP
jgi:hypothetical protein